MKRNFHALLCLLFISLSRLNGQGLTPDQISFLRENARSICKDEMIMNADWDAVASAVKNKRIILVGEFNHGSKQIFELRNDLIRFLHEKMGFNTVLFESGIGELALPELNRLQMSADQMTNGLFGGWRTKEFKDLMEYIKSANISIAGFDVQKTGNSFKQLLNSVASKKNIDTALYNSLEERYGMIQRELSSSKVVFDSVQSKVDRLIADYQFVFNLLSAKEKTIDSKEILLSRKTIGNRIDYLRYMLQFVKDRNWHKRWAARDSAMADNIEWLAENIYKNEKIIVVAHNFHIAKSNETERVMGAILGRRYDKEMYSMGIFASTGIYADNFGKEVSMKPADSTALDIKYTINSTKAFVSYLDIPQKKLKGGEWLYEPIIVNDTFIDLNNSNKLVLAKQFDGILLIKKISPPEKQ